MYIYMTIIRYNILLITIIYLILTPQLCTRTYSADLTVINGPSRTNPQLTADESEKNNKPTRSRTMPLPDQTALSLNSLN